MNKRQFIAVLFIAVGITAWAIFSYSKRVDEEKYDILIGEYIRIYYSLIYYGHPDYISWRLNLIKQAEKNGLGLETTIILNILWYLRSIGEVNGVKIPLWAIKKYEKRYGGQPK